MTRPWPPTSPGCSSWAGCGGLKSPPSAGGRRGRRRRRRRRDPRHRPPQQDEPSGRDQRCALPQSGPARAVREPRAATAPAPAGRVVPLSLQAVGLRFTAAARAAGLERRIITHSGRMGLASELTSRGASTTAAMLARMVQQSGRGWRIGETRSVRVAAPPVASGNA